MKLYIVRHGQSVGNLQHRHQTRETPLSDEGQRQAQFLAQRFETIKLDKIYASTYERAHHTASIIATHLDMDIKTTDLLVEIIRPKEIENKHIYDPQVIAIKRKVFRNFTTHNHYRDEENFYDLKKRVDQFIRSINPQSEESVLVVSHGITIKMLVSRLVFGQLLTPELFVQIIDTWRTENTGISVCHWADNKWNLTIWNDSAHLGEAD